MTKERRNEIAYLYVKERASQRTRTQLLAKPTPTIKFVGVIFIKTKIVQLTALFWFITSAIR